MIASPASRLHNTNHTDALSAQRENLNTNIQRSVVMDEHLELGRCCYKRGEFIEAAEAFGRAIIRAPSVQLYDNRAACREKLNDLPNALKDAQAAIQLQRVDPRGYLRAGEILVKMHKERNALDVYRLALQIIKHVGKGYERLLKAHSDLQEQLSPRNGVDPLVVLPMEIAANIFEYLPFKQLVNACRVSKSWRSFLRGNPQLWHHLDLPMTRHKLNIALVSRVLKFARNHLTTLTLHRVNGYDRILHAIIKSCPIQDITLIDSGDQTKELTGQLAHCMTLKALRMKGGTRLNNPSTNIPFLFCRLGSCLRVFEYDPVIVGFNLFSPTCRPSELRQLTLTFGYNPLNDEWPMLMLPDRVPHLESLKATFNHRAPGNISVDDPVNIDHFVIDLSVCKELKHLELNHFRSDLKLPPSLLTFTLRDTITLRGPRGARNIESLSPTNKLPRLQKLQVASAKWETAVEMINRILDSDEEACLLPLNPLPKWGTNAVLQASKLQSLVIELGGWPWSLNQHNEMLDFLQAPRLTHIKDFGILNAPSFDDGTLEAVLTACRHLETVDLTGSSVTGVGVKQLARNGCLKRLVLDGCYKISADAFAWAREQGISVRCRPKDPRGRRIL